MEPIRWNIFARELDALLQTRGLTLSLLDDRGIVFHREKVRRLQQSLRSPKYLATLNPEEMERLTAVLGLDAREQQWLHAALLATAVEMALLNRLPPDAALAAAEDVFRILFTAACERPAFSSVPSLHGPRLVPTRWNIFARELEVLLQTRGLRLGQLDDRIALHREKVRRLQKSLRSPEHIVTLNPEEMERVTTVLGLDAREQGRLQAALLATAIEMFLLDRVQPLMALDGAEGAFIIFLDCCSAGRLPQETAALQGKEPQTVSCCLRSAPLCVQSFEPEQRVLLPSTTVVTGLVEAWLVELVPATQATYRERIAQFRAVLRTRGYDLLSEPSAITHLAGQWAQTPLTSLSPIGSLHESTIAQRLSTLSSFYRFVGRTHQDDRFLTNPIETRRLLHNYPRPAFALAPLKATRQLQGLKLTSAQNCRDYALLWIALVSGCTPQKLLALTLGHLVPPVLPGQDPFQVLWSQAQPQLPYAPLVLSEDVSFALARYLAECHACMITTLDPSTPLWLSLSDRNNGKPLQDQSIRDIMCKHLHASSLRAFFHARLATCVQQSVSSPA